MPRPAIAFVATAAAVLLVSGCAAAQVSAPAPGRDAPDTIAIVRLARALSHDSMKGRGPWTPENSAAARRLASELATLGARPLVGSSLLVPFVTRDRPADTVYNVIGVLPSRTGTVTGELIGITSHLDHLGIGAADSSGDTIYNGFLDAALPNAMVLDVARRYRASPGDRPLAVVFFNLEERGLLGAIALADRPDAEALFARFKLVIGVDAGAPAGEPVAWSVMGALPPHPAALLADSIARSHGWTLRPSAPRPISDVYVFASKGIPILFPIPGPEWKGYTLEQRLFAMHRWDHYHKPSDQWVADFPLVGTAAFAQWLWEIVRETSK